MPNGLNRSAGKALVRGLRELLLLPEDRDCLEEKAITREVVSNTQCVFKLLQLIVRRGPSKKVSIGYYPVTGIHTLTTSNVCKFWHVLASALGRPRTASLAVVRRLHRYHNVAQTLASTELAAWIKTKCVRGAWNA